jgi:hypothetical protein
MSVLRSLFCFLLSLSELIYIYIMCASMSERRIEYSSYGSGFFLPVYPNPFKLFFHLKKLCKSLLIYTYIHLRQRERAKDRVQGSYGRPEGARDQGR